ncbi:MAG: hypothetical protein L0Z55_08930 [Planctomycetes bacterium]|nr:hypothetical protein [Planctomycetota bacterium]
MTPSNRHGTLTILLTMFLIGCAASGAGPQSAAGGAPPAATPGTQRAPESAARAGEPPAAAREAAPPGGTGAVPVEETAEPEEPSEIAYSGEDFGIYVPPEDENLARAIGSQISFLAGGSEDEKSSAVDALLAMGNRAVVPVLIEQLSRRIAEEQEDDKLRSKIMRGLLSTFPEDAFDVCSYLVLRGNENQQMSGLYGFAMVDHPDQPSMVLPYIAHPNPRLRQAAAYALITPVAILSNAAEHMVVNGKLPDDVDEEMIAERFRRHERSRRMVFAEICKYDLDVPEEIFNYVRRYATYEDARTLVEHYAASVPEEERPVAEMILKMFEANRRWLGRPAPIPATRVAYDFHMFNVMANKGKDFPLQFSQKELDMLRGKENHLDRATKLALSVDNLLTYPQLCRPEMEEEEGGEARLRYQIPLRATLSLGSGAMNIHYWVGRAEGASDATVVVDVERFVPLEETLRDDSGATVATVAYQDYTEIEPGAWVPMKMAIDCLRVPQGEQETRHMRFAAEFQIVEGIWLLRDFTASEVKDDVEETRATADISNVSVEMAGAK